MEPVLPSGNPGQKLTNFELQPQPDNWCWVAVASSIDAFYNGNKIRLKQCDLAQQVLTALDKINGIQCCPLPSQPVPKDCRMGGPTADALTKAGRFLPPVINGPISFGPNGAPQPDIKTEIASGRPIGCTVGAGSDSHALVIYGWENDGEDQVHLLDPLGEPRHERTIPYRDFTGIVNPSFQWTKTYLTRKDPSAAIPLAPPVALPLQAVRSSTLRRRGAAGESSSNEARPANLGSHGVYVATVKDALSGSVLSHSQKICSRRFEFESDALVMAVKFLADGHVIERSEGPSNLVSFQAFEVASQRDDVKRGDCEVRYLKIVGLSIVALWLHFQKDNRGFAKDLVMPLDPTTAIPTGQFLSAQVFSAQCAEAAKTRGDLEV